MEDMFNNRDDNDFGRPTPGFDTFGSVFWSDVEDFGFSDDFDGGRAGDDTVTYRDGSENVFNDYTPEPLPPIGHLPDFEPGRQLSQEEMDAAAHHWFQLYPTELTRERVNLNPFSKLAEAIRGILNFLGL